VTPPTLTVITPSYNQADYLERTIASVLEQEYPALEFVIVDGGSEDGSVEIIESHSQHLAWWVSEPDEGQSDAINKGIERTRGEIVAYLNSDDRFMPGAFAKAVAELERTGAGWLAGGSLDLIDGDPPTDLGVWRPQPPSACEHPPRGRHWWVLAPWHVPQPSSFWRREMFERHGLFRRDLANTFDAEFMLRLALAGEEPALLPDETLAVRLGHPGQKSRDRGRSRAEIRSFAGLFAGELDDRERRLLRRLGPPVAAWRWFRETLLDPALIFGGRVLELVPERVRPPIRGRDRRR
jgi:glycosyltransferase involved in cell wall biosynthesis